jgi:ferric-dicitrate binding protein FerR (iron transport regulator)
MTSSELPEPTPESWDVDAAWRRVRSRTVAAADSGGLRASPAAPRRRRIIAYAAAGVLVVLGVAAGVVRLSRLPGDSAPATGPGQYSTSRAQYATIRLADGSEVTLAPESRITVAARFAEGMREISLEGEAIFNVRHDAAHPLRIRARGVLIEDVGTRFDLRAYANDASVTVAVAEGSVSLTPARSDSASAARKPGQRIVLERGDVGMVDGQGNTSTERLVRVSSYLDWANGRLSFVDRPLDDVLRTIGRWYDLDVRVTDARLRNRRVTAEFAPQSSTEMIDALAVATDAAVERDGRVITLRPR